MNQIPCSSFAGIGVIKFFIPYRTSQITPARMIAPMRSQRSCIAIPAMLDAPSDPRGARGVYINFIILADLGMLSCVIFLRPINSSIAS